MDPLLPHGYTLKEVERFAEPEFTELLEQLLLNTAAHLPLRDLRGLVRSEAATPLGRHRGMRRVGVYVGDELVAFSVAWQEDGEQLYMAASAVRPEHRQRGLYSAMLGRVVARAAADGYTALWSRHLATNNPVIIAKLKAGFVITGMELAADHGTMIKMTLPLHDDVHDALRVRCGARKAPARWSRYLVEDEETATS